MRDEKKWALAEKIEDYVISLQPILKKATDYRSADITVKVSPPRRGMGRFQSYKKHWTIDLVNRKAQERTQQVRVDVKEDETFSFDEKILAEKIASMLRKGEAEQNRLLAVANARLAIPKNLPEGVRVEVDMFNKYRVTFSKTFLSHEQMSDLVEQLAKLKISE